MEGSERGPGLMETLVGRTVFGGIRHVNIWLVQPEDFGRRLNRRRIKGQVTEEADELRMGGR
jgi:hypothetical protein